MITNQELFDNAALGIILHNDGKACMQGAACVIMSQDGKFRCAIGWSVTDAEPGDPDSHQWVEITEAYQIGPYLRDAHDDILACSGFAEWQGYMSRLALAFRLDDSAVYHTLKEGG